MSKLIRLNLALIPALAGTLLLLTLLSASSPAHAAPAPTYRYVATTGVDNPINDCSDKANPCRTVQRAVDKSTAGDVIKVATGVYTDVHSRPVPPGYFDPPASGIITQIVYISKTVTIAGGYTAAFAEPPNPKTNPTILGAKERGRSLVIMGNISPIIRGLHITSGDATGLGGGWGPQDAGGGVYIVSATATLTNNWIFQNAAYEGGGLYLWHSAATLRNNLVTTNTADGPGGGIAMWASDAMLEENAVLSNTASLQGGGLYLNYSNAALTENTVMSNAAYHGAGLSLAWQSAATLTDNIVVANIADGDGGGILLNYSNATFNGNTIASNIADYGGGLYLGNDSRAMLSGNRIVSNAAFYGGGLYIHTSAPTLTNTVITDNRANFAGGGLYITYRAAPRLLHTTIARNRSLDGSGIYVTNDMSAYSAVAMTNTILVSHSIGITVAAGNTATLASTLWYSNTYDWRGAGAIFTGTIEHNYWGLPHFAADGYHLLSGSAAIDRGVTAGVTSDIDGDPRPDCVWGDLGADERQELPCQRNYLPIVLRN